MKLSQKISLPLSDQIIKLRMVKKFEEDEKKKTKPNQIGAVLNSCE